MTCELRSIVNVIDKAVSCNVTVVEMSLAESMLTTVCCTP